MPPDRGNIASLHDMLTAARAVVRFLVGKTRDDFSRDEILRTAIERKVEIIGEAARGISKEYRESHPQVQWHKIMATRHVLAHDCDDVNDDIMWRIATIYVPELMVLIEPLVPSPPPDPEPKR